MLKVSKLYHKILCFFGYHSFNETPILADLDTYWVQGGQQCSHCGVKHISFEDAARIVKLSYIRGKGRSENDFIAYGRGLNKIVEIYGKEHVQKLLDSCK